MKWRLYGLILFVVLIMVACGDEGTYKSQSSVSSLSNKEIVQKVEDGLKGLQSVSQKMSMNATVKSNLGKDELEQFIIQGDADSIYHDNQFIAVHSYSSKNNNEYYDFYFIDDHAYTKSTQYPTWNEMDKEDMVTHSMYPEAVKIFLETAPWFSVTESKEDYIFSFQGKSAHVYDAVRVFGKLYFEGADPKDIDMTLSYAVDRQTFSLRNMKQKFVLKSLLRTTTIQVNVEMSKYNQISSITIPSQLQTYIDVKKQLEKREES